MSRWSSSGSKSHHVARLGWDWYRLSWTVDRYTKNGRIRLPTRYSRDTDEKGAARFCKKWGCRMPPEPERKS